MPPTFPFADDDDDDDDDDDVEDDDDGDDDENDGDNDGDDKDDIVEDTGECDKEESKSRREVRVDQWGKTTGAEGRNKSGKYPEQSHNWKLNGSVR